MHQIMAKISFWCLLRVAWYVDTEEGDDSCLPKDVSIASSLTCPCLTPTPHSLATEINELEVNFPSEDFSIQKCWLDWIEMFHGNVSIPPKLSVEIIRPWLGCLTGKLALPAASSPTCLRIIGLRHSGCKFSQPTGFCRARHQLGVGSCHAPCMGQHHNHVLPHLWRWNSDSESLFWFLTCDLFIYFLVYFYPTENSCVLFCLSVQMCCQVLRTTKWCPFIYVGKMVSSTRNKFWKDISGFSSPFYPSCSQSWQSHLWHYIKVPLQCCACSYRY